MPSPLNNTPHNKRVRNALLGLLVLGLVVFAIDRIAPHMLSKSVNTIARPILESQALTDSYVAQVTTVLKEKQSLKQRNNELQKELQQVRKRLLRMHALEAENARLRKQVGRHVKSDTRKVYARVLARPPASVYDTLLIDVGTKVGVSAGDRVLAGDAVILGRVVSASEDTARIRLLSHPEMTIEAVIYGNAKTTTTVTGAGGGNYRTRLPAGVDVSVGNTVIDARTGDYVLGSVREVRKADSDSFQHILFRTPVNIQQLRFVTVITDNTNE